MIDINNYRQKVSHPISAESPAGERLIDDPLYDFIDEQMMKVGSLAHSSIQWAEVEQAAITLLSEKTKDIKLFTYFIQCLHHELTPERIILSFETMTDFIEHFWQDCFPSPGERGKLPRRKFFSLLLNRFNLMIDKYDFAHFSSQDQDLLISCLDSWRSAIEKNELDLEASDQIIQSIKTKLKEAEERDIINSAKPNEVYVQSSSSSNRSISIDASSEQSIKETFLKVSDFLIEKDANELLALRIRRYALWGNINSPPEYSKEGETQLRAMLPEKIKEYNDGLANPDISLWRKLEKSLLLAPYWLDGHYLSAQIAKAIGQQKWSEAIHGEAVLFIEKLPKLLELSFKDGTPFVSSDTRSWLETSNSSGAHVVNSDWQEIAENIHHIANEAGVSIAITKINEGLEQATEPRDKFYWRFILAELLAKHHLNAMANEQYKELQEQAKATTLELWEPSLLERLDKLVTDAKEGNKNV